MSCPAPLGEPLTPSPLFFQQVKSIERFLRRLEFHASKVGAGERVGLWAFGLCVAQGLGDLLKKPLSLPAACPPAPYGTSGLSLQIDELYEAYCIQRRLRDGAHNMVKAYSTGSPGSREARESLAEASKGYKEYTEVRQRALGGLGGCRHRGLWVTGALSLVPRTCACWRASWRASWGSSTSG